MCRCNTLTDKQHHCYSVISTSHYNHNQLVLQEVNSYIICLYAYHRVIFKEVQPNAKCVFLSSFLAYNSFPKGPNHQCHLKFWIPWIILRRSEAEYYSIMPGNWLRHWFPTRNNWSNQWLLMPAKSSSLSTLLSWTSVQKLIP